MNKLTPGKTNISPPISVYEKKLGVVDAFVYLRSTLSRRNTDITIVRSVCIRHVCWQFYYMAARLKELIEDIKFLEHFHEKYLQSVMKISK